MIFALAGNQNCGKTTLFNQLTGSNQHVGNFPGVTVDRKDGVIRGHKEATVVDLPGIYSLAPYTSEEIVTRDFLLNEKPDGIINIIDATNIERNLYLSLQLIQLDIPMILALNMMDELRSNGGTIKISEMQKELGVPVIPISASKNEGIDELIELAIKTVSLKQKPQRKDFCSGAVHRSIHAISHLIEDHAERIAVPVRFAATKIVEGDKPILHSLNLSQNEIETIEHSIVEMETELHTDRKAAIADMRYNFIEKLCIDTVVKPKESKQHLRSVRIDNVLTNKYLAIPIFLSIMMIIFWLTFGVIGSFFSNILADAITYLTNVTSSVLKSYGINPVVHSLVIDGIFAGVGSVLSFIPTIVILFFFLSLLEDSGYMARVAFVMDKLLRKIGLSGRSFVPMLIGFGCSVPAIMATRTLSSERDRKMTILLTPFMSCSAKLPIYAMFTMAFFQKYRALVMISLYVLGMLLGILSALIFKSHLFKGNPVPFVMELPNYRLPSAKSVLLLLWDKAKDFLTRAFTIIFLATIIIWFFQTFDARLNVTQNGQNSMLVDIGKFIAPVFAPLGFNDWKAATALITGFTAKESVISTLAVLTSSNTNNLPNALTSLFTPLTAFVFLVFTLIYTPCVAAISTVKREMNSVKAALWVIIYQTGFAWLVAFVIYRIGILFIN
ncbi:ferrous iron transport protein B [Clostridium oryzae]|uniref:Ferrous iron transport protein B n=1 Tax=Clostridium oryzae TaxID=1450648 RepID=A0A1V4IBW8_9CLOT|nr:ferrous iron transport protein B [Clostridium oryzae]OPJ57481.1 ferrous iron transport protein B [Clostridium oryzae]